MVLFQTPVKNSHIEVGLLMTVWKGLKSPKPHAGEVPVQSCVAFRAVQLSPSDDLGKEWEADWHSVAWVVRLEGLITILDVEESASFAVFFDIFAVHSSLCVIFVSVLPLLQSYEVKM